MSKGQDYVDANPLNIPVKEFSGKEDRIPVFIYLRLSPTNIEGVDKEGTRDFSRQEATIKRFTETEMPRNFEVVGQFVDIGHGSDANRPEYKRMISLLKARKAKVVIASSLARYGRSLPEFLKNVDTIRALNCELRLIRNGLVINNDNNPLQNLMMNVFGAVAEFEAEIASNRVQEKVAIKRQNPFWWTGQKPKVTGEDLKDFIDMYYATKPRQTGGKGPWKPKPTYSKTETSFKYSLQEIADHFNMAKASASEMVKKYVNASIMVHRSPKKATKIVTVNWLDLPAYNEGMNKSKHRKGGHSILHPLYWPENIRKDVSKKFGDYKKIEKFNSKDKSLAAWKFGKKVYFGWLKAYVKNAQENADIFTHHSDLLSGGDMGGLVNIKKRISDSQIKALSVDDLAKTTEEES